MIKYILFLVSVFVTAQVFPQARNATTTYQKVKQSAVEVELPFPENMVTRAVEDKLQKAGYKGKDTKGFITYKGVRMAELGPDAYDLYFKTDRKSRKEIDATLLTMLVSSGYEKFYDSDSPVMLGAKNFLDSQLVMVEAYDLEVQVTEQETEIKKADKKMASLVEEAEDLQKKKKKLEKEIEENLLAQENQKKQAATQGQILNTLKTKRKQ
jgi:hypothetical protein